MRSVKHHLKPIHTLIWSIHLLNRFLWRVKQDAWVHLSNLSNQTFGHWVCFSIHFQYIIIHHIIHDLLKRCLVRLKSNVMGWNAHICIYMIYCVFVNVSTYPTLPAVPSDVRCVCSCITSQSSMSSSNLYVVLFSLHHNLCINSTWYLFHSCCEITPAMKLPVKPGAGFV